MSYDYHFVIICQVCVSMSSKCLYQQAQMNSNTFQSPREVSVSIQNQTHYEITLENILSTKKRNHKFLIFYSHVFLQ